MKRIIYRTVTSLTLIIVIIFMTGVSRMYAEMSLSTGLRYDWFQDDGSPKTTGREMTIPLGFAWNESRWLFSVQTACSSARVEDGEATAGYISSCTDTLISTSFLVRNEPVGMMIGVDVNLPTGKEQLSATEEYAEAGRKNDLFEVDNFGDGLNIGLNLGLVKEVAGVSLSVNGAYLVKGGFDPTRDFADDDLEPGEQTLVVALLKWRLQPWLTLDASVAHSWFTPDTRNGIDVFQEGNTLVSGGSLRIRRKALDVAAGLQYTLQDNNKRRAVEDLERETENSNGDEFFGKLDITYTLSPRLMLRVLGNAKFYGESKRRDALKDLPYAAKRVRYAAGPGVVWSVNNRVTVDFLAKYFTMTQEKQIDPEHDISYHGLNLALGLTYIL